LQPRAAIEWGGCVLRVLFDRQRQNTLRDGPCDPVSHAELCCPRPELLQRPLGVSPRRIGEGGVLRGDVGLERGQVCLPRVPHGLGTHRMPPPPIAAALLCEPRAPLLIAEVQLPAPCAQPCVHLGFRDGGKGMAPLRGEVCALLALDHPSGTHEGHLWDAQPVLALHPLGSQGLRLWGMAGKHCDRNGRPVLVAESTNDHLQLPFFPIAMGAKGGPGVVGAFHGAPGDIRQKQAGRCRLLALRTEAILSPGWGSRQPIPMLRERIFIKRVSAKHGTGRVGQRQTHS
jgi:hypothetical protein